MYSFGTPREGRRGDSGIHTVPKALCIKTHWGWAVLALFFQIQKLRHSKK